MRTRIVRVQLPLGYKVTFHLDYEVTAGVWKHYSMCDTREECETDRKTLRSAVRKDMEIVREQKNTRVG
tara:strand:- start:868 stop:1074 length:207 start_codon:yes stop_codon:yes gene_type:complete